MGYFHTEDAGKRNKNWQELAGRRCMGACAFDLVDGYSFTAGVDRVWVDHESFLAKVWGKTGSKLYSKTSAADYADNLQVISCTQRAVECDGGSTYARHVLMCPTLSHENR